MALWMVRAGRHGEYEDRFLSESRIYLTWDTFDGDLRGVSSRSEIIEKLRQRWPNAADGKIRNHAGQIWAFLRSMADGDLVVVPGKKTPTLHFGLIRSEPQFESSGEPQYRHFRAVEWLRDVPRAEMDKDILYSLGAIMTICEISRNDAEARIRRMLELSSPTPSVSAGRSETVVAEEDAAGRDYEQLARDEIATAIIRRFKGHGLERLVDAILRAQGYVTHHSPMGADGGVDIVAGSGHLGFASPKLCVQVKSEQTPIEHAKLSQLLGTMQSVGADQGLLVSWSGFKSSIHRVAAQHFFKVRLWDQQTLLDQLFQYYDRLDPEIRAELPLKRIWAVVAEELEEGE